MPLTLGTIAAFAGNTLSSYFSKKGLDSLLFSDPKFKHELEKTIVDTLEEYEQKYPQNVEVDKFPFYQSQRIINELLSYRVMHESEYNTNDLLAALRSEQNVIPPTVQNIEDFYQLFVERIRKNAKLKSLEIKQTFQTEIFIISKKLDDLQRNIENISTSLSVDLEKQWKSRLDTYILTIQKFKPSTALGLLTALSKSFDESSNKPSVEFLSLLEYQKGICLGFLDDVNLSSKAFIKASKLNSSNSIFKERAMLAYYRIDEIDKAKQIADELLQIDEFNSPAWAIILLTTPISDLWDKIAKLPNIVKQDIEFTKLLFNTYARKGEKDNIQIMYDAGLIPSASLFREFPITIDTYSEYAFWINITGNEYFSSFYLNFYEIDDRNQNLSQSLNHLIGNFLAAVSGTEIDKSNGQLTFLYAYTNFLRTKEKKYALEMKDTLAVLNNIDALNLALCANALQLSNEDDVAIQLLESATNETRELLMLKGYCYVKLGNIEKYVSVTRSFVRIVREVPNNLLNSYANIPIQLKVFGQLGSFSLEEFVTEKTFESIEAKSLVVTITSILIDGGSAALVDELNGLSDFFKGDAVILGLIGDALHLTGENEAAVQIFRRFITAEEQSRELLYYIYALYHTKKDSGELLQLLAKWRLNFEFYPDFLKAEIEMRSQLLDWKGCVDICEYYLSKKPQDEHILTNYAIALYNENNSRSNEVLSKLQLKLKDFEYKSLTHVSTVSQILVKRDFFEAGIHLLYRYARNKENVELRREYFMACVASSQSGKDTGLLREVDEATEGAFVKYELNRKVFIIELSSENIKKDFFKSFLGARQGGGIVVKRPLTEVEDVLSIQRIMNKYLALHDEILVQVEGDPHSGVGLTSILFEPDDVNSINETFKSLFGAKGTANKINVDEQLRKYYNHELSFSHIVMTLFDHDYVGGYHHLVNQRDGITTIPLIFLKPIVHQNTEYVIDFTSLLILFQMYKEHHITFSTKFFISKYIVDRIKRKADERTFKSETELSLTITSDHITPHFFPPNMKDQNRAYLNELLMWVDNNCTIQISERILDFTRNIQIAAEQRPIIDYTIGTTLLVEDFENRILVTDDTQYSRFGFVPRNRIVSSEFLAKNFLGDQHIALVEFLKNKYHGFSVNVEQLNSEHEKRGSSQEHFYNTCLENLNLLQNPNSAIPAILHIKDMVINHTILAGQLRQDVTSVFVSLMKGIDPALRNNVELLVKLNCSLLGNKLNLIIESLRAAYLILDAF